MKWWIVDEMVQGKLWHDWLHTAQIDADLHNIGLTIQNFGAEKGAKLPRPVTQADCHPYMKNEPEEQINKDKPPTLLDRLDDYTKLPPGDAAKAFVASIKQDKEWQAAEQP